MTGNVNKESSTTRRLENPSQNQGRQREEFFKLVRKAQQGANLELREAVRLAAEAIATIRAETPKADAPKGKHPPASSPRYRGLRSNGLSLHFCSEGV